MKGEKFQVLVIEDDATDALLVKDELAHAPGAQFSVVHVEQLNEALAQLKAQCFDVVLLDLNLPDSRGFETFVRLHEAAPDIPIVVLSGRTDGPLAVQAVQAGAQDYLVKGREGEGVLPRSIRYAIERQRTDRTLAESKERYRLLIQQSPDAYLVHCDGKIVFANAAALKLHGADRPEQLLGKSFLERVSPEFRDLIARRVEKTHGNGSNPPIEVLSLRLDGTTVAVEETSNSFIHEGRPAVQVVLHDLTERKRADEELRLMRFCVDHAGDGVFWIGPDGRVLYANKSACQRLGYSEAELLALKIFDLDLDQHPDAWGEQWAELRRRGTLTFESRQRTKAGRLFPVEINANYVRAGAQEFTFAFTRDITERKRSEERFRWLVDSNAQGVMFWNTKGEITEANNAFLGMVGYTREDLEAGRINWAEMTPPEYADLDRRNLEEIAARGVCAPQEKEFFRKDGARVPILLGSAAFEDNPEEGVCFMLDLTERKKLEQHSLRAQRMESIGTLAGGIAHDLNNALGPIIMSLELLQMKFTDAASQELLAIISSSAQRGADMVRQVLSFARGVEGRRMEVQIRHLVRDIEKISNDTFLKDIQLRTIIPHDLWTVTGDPTQLHQVLLNLCLNARDAMSNGGTLTLSAENLILDAHYAGLSLEAKPGPYVFVQVADSGTGMPPEVMDKIFDPFFTTKEVGKGTGLGLSTSLAIVKSHGGFIRVYSEVRKGTTFKVYLPAQTETSPAAAAELAAEMPRGNGELILVVDDEASVRQITQQTLEAFGYRVVLAADGTDAVTVFARQSAEIAAVLTDMTMPVMDGPATIRVLRKMNPKVRIIAASGLAAADRVAQVASLGVKHFLPKPYTAEAMLKVLKELLAEE